MDIFGTNAGAGSITTQPDGDLEIKENLVLGDGLTLEDLASPPDVPEGTNGVLYNLAGDDNLYWKTTGGGVVDLTTGAGMGAGALQTSGGVMTGNITMNSNDIIMTAGGLVDGVDVSQLSTDVSNKYDKSGGLLSGNVEIKTATLPTLKVEETTLGGKVELQAGNKGFINFKDNTQTGQAQTFINGQDQTDAFVDLSIGGSNLIFEKALTFKSNVSVDAGITIDGRDISADWTTTNGHITDNAKHREINDATTSTTELWSSNKISTDLGNKVDVGGDTMTGGLTIQTTGSGNLEIKNTTTNNFINNRVDLGVNKLEFKDAVLGKSTLTFVGYDSADSVVPFHITTQGTNFVIEKPTTFNENITMGAGKLVDGRDISADWTTTNGHITDNAKHREINDATTSTTELWSSNKISTELSGKQDVIGAGNPIGTLVLDDANASHKITFQMPDVLADGVIDFVGVGSVVQIGAIQTLQNKTMIDATNNIAANSLRTNAGAVSVVDDNPSVGQVLIADTTASATWQDLPASVSFIDHVYFKTPSPIYTAANVYFLQAQVSIPATTTPHKYTIIGVMEVLKQQEISSQPPLQVVINDDFQILRTFGFIHPSTLQNDLGRQVVLTYTTPTATTLPNNYYFRIQKVLPLDPTNGEPFRTGAVEFFVFQVE